MVSLKSTTSWLTRLTCERKSIRRYSRTSIPSKQHRPSLNIVEARHQADQRRLAAAGAADDGDGFARPHVETHIVQHILVVASVAEGHVAEFDLAARARNGARAAAALGRLIQELEHALAGGDALLQGPAHVHETAQRRRDLHQGRQKSQKFVHLHVVREHLPNRHIQHARERDRGDALHHRVADRFGARELHIRRAIEFIDLLEPARFGGPRR